MSDSARYEEGDEVVVTDFEGVKHQARLERVVPVFHECDDIEAGLECSHKVWAAVWPIEGAGIDPGSGRHIWPIVPRAWDRLEPKKDPPEVKREDGYGGAPSMTVAEVLSKLERTMSEAVREAQSEGGGVHWAVVGCWIRQVQSARKQLDGGP